MKRLQILALAATAFIFAGKPADAALSGYWESSKVLHALLGREDLADALKQQPISSIEATRTGYRIKSHDCTVDAIVERRGSRRPGPGGFVIRIGNGRCR